MISNFQDIPTFTSLKSHLLSLIRPKIKSTFGIHDALGLRYLFQLRVNLSPLRSHKKRHNFSDTPSETCECNLGIEDIRHFLFECPFYAIQSLRSFVFHLFYLLLYSCFFLLYFCHGFGLFSLQSHGIFQKRKSQIVKQDICCAGISFRRLLRSTLSGWVSPEKITVLFRYLWQLWVWASPLTI